MDKVGDQLPAVSSALAGLILVFLGVVYSAWLSYSPADQASVQWTFKFRAWLCFAGMFLAIASAGCGLIAIGQGHKNPNLDFWGCGLLATATLLTIIVAGMTVKEI